MGRWLLSVVKSILTAVIVCGMLIASFYFAYLLLIMIVLGVVFVVAHRYHVRADQKWFKYEDSD